MDTNPPRRRVLQLAGAGTLASLAGCSALSDSGDTSQEGDQSDDDMDDMSEAEGVVMFVEPSQEDLQSMREEVSSQVESGEIDQAEAQSIIQERQGQLTTETVETVTSDLAGNLSVVDSVPEFGAVLIDGDADAMIEQLNVERVSALLPPDIFEQIQTQAQQTQTSG